MVLTACALTSAVGCSSDTGVDEKPEKATPSTAAGKPSPSADPTQAAETAAVDAYAGYWRTLETLYADSSSNTDQLKKVASGLALVNVERDVKQLHDKGNLITGNVSVVDSTVTASDIDRKAPKVVLTSCLDITKWTVVKASTKKPLPLPSTRLTKYLVTSTLERWPQGWVVIEDKPQGKAC
ncbi:hypothetical protein [Streptomyces sp. NPDC014623]|uniref:hypothetical protein n=1 Tax=Streptomyces sp. NPDC014623 TaxID=3364875 RepID=UPI0036FDE231